MSRGDGPVPPASGPFRARQEFERLANRGFHQGGGVDVVEFRIVLHGIHGVGEGDDHCIAMEGVVFSNLA